jgi:putative effector of murein hydrolase
VNHLTTFLLVCATLAAYRLMLWLYLRRPHPLLNVVVLSAALVAALLLGLEIPYADYLPASEIMTLLLGPATVGLAVPLYRRRALLVRCALPILASVAAGALSSMLVVGAITFYGGLPREVVISALPKGVSIPFAVEVASLYGGVPALSVALVVATAVVGASIGTWALNLFGVLTPMARGLALGTMAHAQGTAVAFMEGEEQGSMAGLALILAGVITAAFAPLAVWLFG